MIRVAIAVIRNLNNQFLVGLRDEKSSFPLTWCFLGGKYEEKDGDIYNTVKRELREECNFIVPGEHTDHYVEHIIKFNVGKYEFTCFVFLPMDCSGQSLKPLDGTKELRWLTLDELSQEEYLPKDGADLTYSKIIFNLRLMERASTIS